MKWIIELLKSLFKTKTETPAVNPDLPLVQTPAEDKKAIEKLDTHIKVLEIAEKEKGVKEFAIGSNKVIEKYHSYATIDNKKGADDSIPWCSSFMCYVMETAGLKSTNSKSARSWEKWGTETKNPIIGDVVVFWRESKSSGKGHVALFMGFDSSDNIRCLGGNQGDAVCIATYDKSRVLSFRTY